VPALLSTPPSQAQVYRIGTRYSPSPGYLGFNATSPYYGAVTYGDINGYPPRMYSSFATGALPTYMTSINYPWMYGAYGYYYAPGRFTYGATPARGTMAETLYGSYLPSENGLYYDRVVPDTAITPVVRTADIDIRVPADAELRFDGTLTAETGELRRFITPALIAGKAYRYDISVTWNEDGRPIRRDRQVTFQAGDRLLVDLTRPPSGEERTSTLRSEPRTSPGAQSAPQP